MLFVDFNPYFHLAVQQRGQMAQLITLTLTEKNEKQPAQQRDATKQQQQLQGHERRPQQRQL